MSFLLERHSCNATSTTARWKAVELLTWPLLNEARRTFSARQCLRERRLPLAEERQPPIPRHASSKVYQSADDAISDLKDGTTVLSAGFGLSGVAGTFILHPIRHCQTLLYWFARMLLCSSDSLFSAPCLYAFLLSKA